MGEALPGDLARLALRRAPVPTALLDRHAVVAASESFAAVLGVPLSELIGTPIADLPMTPADSAPLEAALTGEGHAVRLPGGRLSRLRTSTLSGDGHRLIQLDGLGGDEQELRTTIRWLRDLVDNSTALMYIKALDGRYLVANRYFARRFGISADQVLGRTDHDMFPAEAADVYRRNDLQVITTGRSMEVEEPFAEVDSTCLPDGGGSWLSIKFPLLDARGEPYALGAISTDITDRKRAEAAARRARDEAERANRAKSEFLSRMSHELRTPLNAIIGFAQLLQMERLEPAGGESVEHILDAGRHLLVLVNEVLDLSWIEAGAPGLDVVEVHACEPLQEALELMRPMAHERDVELASDLHDALHRYVRADPHRLKQVFLNLLSNAIKYNRPAGAVRVRCAADGRRIRYLVTDTGAGISPADLDRLFAPFVRLAPERDTEGSGLGLALSRLLIQEMGGEIGVLHSAPGDGSTFYVELPLTDSPANADVPARPSDDGLRTRPGPRSKVLYIEDTYANLRLVENIVGRMGDLELITATQGELGLELAARHRPELILLDLHLVDINGEEVIRRLGADERTKDIPVIVVSADATPASILQVERAGAVDYLTKPLDVHGFARAVRRALASP